MEVPKLLLRVARAIHEEEFVNKKRLRLFHQVPDRVKDYLTFFLCLCALILLVALFLVFWRTNVKHLVCKIISEYFEYFEVHIWLHLLNFVQTLVLIPEYLVELVVSEAHLSALDHHYTLLKTLKNLLVLVLQLIEDFFLFKHVVDVQNFPRI